MDSKWQFRIEKRSSCKFEEKVQIKLEIKNLNRNFFLNKLVLSLKCQYLNMNFLKNSEA